VWCSAWDNEQNQHGNEKSTLNLTENFFKTILQSTEFFVVNPEVV
jgi:hypothetical protein